MVTSWSFIPLPTVDGMVEVKGSPPRRYTSPLDLGHLIDYPHSLNDREVTFTRSLHTRRRLLPLVAVPDPCL